MDREILEWISKEPQDWWQKTQSTVYTWGKGSWNQLGTSTRENSSPALAEEWKDVQQVPSCCKFVSVDCSSHKELPPPPGCSMYILCRRVVLFYQCSSDLQFTMPDTSACSSD